jgi:undecaprenyl-diphosphatase
VFLGVIQGLTEFLPVSSSGHIALIEKFLGLTPTIAFVVLLHFGTLLAVLIYFRAELFSLALSFFRGTYAILTAKETPRAIFYSDTKFRMSCFLISGTLVTAAVALAIKDIVESLFSNLQGIGVFWLVTAFIILLAERIGTGKKLEAQMGFIDTIAIGAAQGLAAIPGLSRSGATISTSLMVGLERNFAAKFSFLLSVPAILAAGLFELKDMMELKEIGVGRMELAAGFIASVIAGMLAIKVMLAIISRTSIRVFAYYCLALGVVVILLSR